MNTNSNKEVGSLIKTLRISKGLTQSELAQKLKMSNGSFISKIEKGNSEIGFNKASRIFKELGIDLIELLKNQ